MDLVSGLSAYVAQSKALESVHPIPQQLWKEELPNMGWTSDDHDDPKTSMTRYTMLFYNAAFRDAVTDPNPSLSSQPGYDLNGWLAKHCPPALHTFYDLWRRLVPAIRALSTKDRDHLWRIICGSGCVSPSFSHDSHLYGIADTLQAVSEAFYKWCSRRDEPPKALRNAPSIARFNMHAPSPTIEDVRMFSEDSTVNETMAADWSMVDINETVELAANERDSMEPDSPHSEQQIHIMNIAIPRSFPVLNQRSSTIEPTPEVTWVVVSPPSTSSSEKLLPPLPSGCAPHIWTSDRQELCEVLPDFGSTKANIAFEQIETPVLFLDGPQWPQDEWDGGRKIRLAMTRTYEFRRLHSAHASNPRSTIISEQQLGVKPVVPSDVGLPAHSPSSKDIINVLLPDSIGLDAGYTVGIDGDLAHDVQPTPAALTLPPDNAPLEIGALLRARKSHLPVSVILCRSASLAPFGLSADHGCVFLGFFFVSDVDVTSTAELCGESTEGWTICGRRTWIFDFEWTPGGEDADALLARSMIPWWMKKPELSAQFGESASEATESLIAEGARLGHGFTLLPLHFLASSQTGDEVRGWHCKACGKINVQRNLCIQHCSSCSTSNAIAAVSIEYVRQVHGMDPVTFPMDRATESVARSSSAAPDGLRDFAYAFSTTAFIHHLFTKNHAGVQEEPNRLFHDLQTAIEISSSPTNTTRNGARKSHAVYVAEFSASQRSAGQWPEWPTSTPECVSRARGLMLRRSRLKTYATDLTINCIAINAWRRAGKKRGSLMAKDAPVVILALGADIDLSFVRDSVAPARSAPPKSSRLSLPTAPEGVDVSQGDISDCESEAQDVSWSTGPIIKKQKAPKGKSEEILAVTLVHGDMLVVEGGVFEYSMKRTGMSIVLYGSQ